MNKKVMILLSVVTGVLACVWSAVVDCYIWNHLLKYFFSNLPDLTVGMAIFVLTPIRLRIDRTGFKKTDVTLDTFVKGCVKSFISNTIVLLIAWIGKWFLVY